jgi:hypothetical protein
MQKEVDTSIMDHFNPWMFVRFAFFTIGICRGATRYKYIHRIFPSLDHIIPEIKKFPAFCVYVRPLCTYPESNEISLYPDNLYAYNL